MDNNCVFSTDDVMVRVMARMDELRVAGGSARTGPGHSTYGHRQATCTEFLHVISKI